MADHAPLKRLTRTALLLALTLAVQSLRLPTPFTGPLVNFMLILSTALIGPAGGAMIGLITPGAALLLGVIPPLLGPAIPFIMAGNALFCLSFGLGRRLFKTGSSLRLILGALPGLVLGALLKFAVIAGAARFLLEIPPPAAEALALPQLLNALIGGVAALPVFKWGRFLT